MVHVQVACKLQSPFATDGKCLCLTVPNSMTDLPISIVLGIVILRHIVLGVMGYLLGVCERNSPPWRENLTTPS